MYSTSYRAQSRHDAPSEGQQRTREELVSQIRRRKAHCCRLQALLHVVAHSSRRVQSINNLLKSTPSARSHCAGTRLIVLRAHRCAGAILYTTRNSENGTTEEHGEAMGSVARFPPLPLCLSRQLSAAQTSVAAWLARGQNFDQADVSGVLNTLHSATNAKISVFGTPVDRRLAEMATRL